MEAVTTAPPVERSRSRARLLEISSWCVVAVWIVTALIAALWIGTSTQAVAEAVNGASLALFVVLHAASLYRAAGVVGYLVVAAVVSFGFEACSVSTGFPFGFYVHHLQGPRLLGVPAAVVVGWVTLAWLAWSVARLIVGDRGGRRFAVIATPLVGTLILGGYDLVQDPIAANVRGLYSYQSPSGALGVPISNFFGWILTGWVLLLAFSLFERRWRRAPSDTSWAAQLMPSVIWLGLAVQVNLQLLCVGDAAATMPGGRSISAADVYESSAATAWFTMALAAVVAAVRIFADKPAGAPQR